MIHDNYDPERDAADIKHLVIGLIMGLIACALITMCTGCTTTKYVPVESQHTEHHWHTDSIYERDSVIKESLTTVMQLDSAAMAKYGIQLKSAERAWLVKSQELESFIVNMESLSGKFSNIADKADSTMTSVTSIASSISGSDLEAVISSFKDLLENMNDPDGTIGKLFVDNSVYDSVDALLSDVDSLVRKIQENPKKYIRISVF